MTPINPPPVPTATSTPQEWATYINWGRMVHDDERWAEQKAVQEQLNAYIKESIAALSAPVGVSEATLLSALEIVGKRE